MEEFCLHYNIYLAQLAPYVYKVIRILTKFADLVGVELTLQHLVNLFAPSLYRGTMLNVRHRGGKYLVVNMDDKAHRQFWLNIFYIRIEDVVANVDCFLEAWNYTHKCLISIFILLLAWNYLKDSPFLAVNNQPPLLVTRISVWVEQILPHVIGIHDWPSFFKKFKPALHSTGNFFHLVVVDLLFVVCRFILLT